jgi:hypothetical protein
VSPLQFFFLSAAAALQPLPFAPSLGALVSSDTLIRCESVQVYHHHPRPRILLDSVYNIIYAGISCMGLPTSIAVLAIFLSCGLDDRATVCRPLGSRWSWLVYSTEFSSGRWPASGFVGHNCGCRIAGPPTLPRNRLWVFLVWGHSKQQVAGQLKFSPKH